MRPSQSPFSPVRSFRSALGCEELESRCVPSSTFRWSPFASTDDNWTSSSNWKEYSDLLGWRLTTSYPGEDDAGDTAEFPAGSKGRAIVNQAVTIGALKIDGNSTPRIVLTQTLTVTDEFRMWGGTLADGSLNLASGAKGTWEGGIFAQANVTIALKAELQIWNTNRKLLNNSTLTVQGTLWWSGGDVQTSGAAEVRAGRAHYERLTV